jgi:hypothetical protein
VLRKGETFEPPTPEEEWTDRQFSIILNYLSQYQVPFDGRISLKWLAFPYISIWKANSRSKKESLAVWIMHNKLQTDCFIASSQLAIQEVIKSFGERWIQAGDDLRKNPVMKIDNPDEYGTPQEYAAQLSKYGEMFIKVANDKELNFCPAT